MAGSSGAFFHVADRILQMKEYKPLDITELAKKAASTAPETDVRLMRDSRTNSPSVETPDSGITPGTTIGARLQHADTQTNGITPAAHPSEGRKITDIKDSRVPIRNEALLDTRRVKVRGSGTDSISLNHESVELRFVEQVVDHEQANLLGMLLRTLEEDYFDGRTLLSACVERLFQSLQKQGFSAIHGDTIPGNLAMVRKQELYAMVNRYRALKLKLPHLIIFHKIWKFFSLGHSTTRKSRLPSSHLSVVSITK